MTPVVHLKVFAPHLTRKPLGEPGDDRELFWSGPREVFSPSQMSMHAECEIAWGLKYLEGLKPIEKKVGTEDGGIIHHMLEQYMLGIECLPLESPDPLERYLAQRAFPALTHIPRPEDCLEVRIEQPLVIPGNTQDAIVGKSLGDLFQFESYIDLSVKLRSDERRYLWDYKSTKDFRYAKTPRELKTDAQGVLYPLAEMARTGQDTLDGRWLYLLTDPEHRPGAEPTDAKPKPPAAKPVDATFTWAETVENAKPWFARLAKMRHAVRERPHPLTLQPNREQCRKYYSPKKKTGGCPYRSEIGGPCTHDQPNFATYIFGQVPEQTVDFSKYLSTPIQETITMPEQPMTLQDQINAARAKKEAALQANGGATQAAAPAPQAPAFAPPPPPAPANVPQPPVVFPTPPAHVPAFVPPAFAPAPFQPPAQSPMYPPEAYAPPVAPAPVAAPHVPPSPPAPAAQFARPPAPPGWEYGPDGNFVQVATPAPAPVGTATVVEGPKRGRPKKDKGAAPAPVVASPPTPRVTEIPASIPEHVEERTQTSATVPSESNEVAEDDEPEAMPFVEVYLQVHFADGNEIKVLIRDPAMKAKLVELARGAI